MVSYDALMKDLNNSEVELSRLPALLHELSNKIVENWLELKSNDGNIRSIRKTALKYTLYELKPSIKLNIITKVGHEVSEEIMRQVLAGLGISDLHIGENLIGVSTPDPKLIAAIVYTLSNVLHKDSITTYLYPMIIEGSRKLSVPFHIFIRRNGELDDFVVNVDRARSLINNPSVPDYLRSWLISAVNNWGSVKVRRVFVLFGMLLMVCLVGVLCLVGLLVMVFLVMLVGVVLMWVFRLLLMMWSRFL